MNFRFSFASWLGTAFQTADSFEKKEKEIGVGGGWAVVASPF